MPIAPATDAGDREPLIGWINLSSADESNRLKAALEEIHAIMCRPHDWSSDTIAYVADIMLGLGFTFPDEGECEDVDGLEVEDPLVQSLFARHRPPFRRWSGKLETMQDHHDMNADQVERARASIQGWSNG
jgi:hypothetical protein